MGATHGIKGVFHYDRHSQKVWVGDTDLGEWLLDLFKRGTYVSLHTTEIDPPKDWHIPEEQRHK